MKLGLMGPQCSGKSTKISTISDGLQAFKISHYIVSEGATACPYEINEDVGFDGEYWIINNQINKEAEAEFMLRTRPYTRFILTDRTIYDVIPYSVSAYERGNMNADQLRCIIDKVKMAEEKLIPYDEIWYCKPLKLTDSNPKRSLSKDFQDEIHERFLGVIKDFDLESKTNLVFKN